MFRAFDCKSPSSFAKFVAAHFRDAGMQSGVPADSISAESAAISPFSRPKRTMQKSDKDKEADGDVETQRAAAKAEKSERQKDREKEKEKEKFKETARERETMARVKTPPPVTVVVEKVTGEERGRDRQLTTAIPTQPAKQSEKRDSGKDSALSQKKTINQPIATPSGSARLVPLSIVHAQPRPTPPPVVVDFSGLKRPPRPAPLPPSSPKAQTHATAAETKTSPRPQSPQLPHTQPPAQTPILTPASPKSPRCPLSGALSASAKAKEAALRAWSYGYLEIGVFAFVLLLGLC